MIEFSSEELKRYNRQILIPNFGIQGQEALKKARVLVIGCGGLGSPVLYYLAAAGIGVLGLVEDDTVEASNLQRQILFSIDSVGKSKIEEAEKKIKALNPNVEVELWKIRLSSANAIEIFIKYDLVVDATDNFPTRYLINDACVLANKPFVYGAIHRFEGQVAVFNYQGSATYRDLFASPPPPEMSPNCSEAGVLGVMAGIIGTLQANEAIKIITNMGEILAGKLLLVDSLSMSFRTISIPKSNIEKITQLIDYEQFCENIITNEITYEELKNWKNEGKDFQLIDVREPHEYAQYQIGGDLLPLSEIEKHLPKISRDKTVVVHCQSGIRSQQAIKILKEKHGFENLINLKNGLKEVI